MTRQGLTALASPLPGTRWYFAVQAAGAGAQQLLYILNPNAVPAPVTFTYYRDHTAALLSARLIVPAASTAIEDVGADIGPLSDEGVSIVVNSPRVISVARVLRRAGAGAAILNADITPGVMAPARQWLFAEGYIGLTYHEYLTLFNPNPASARVTVRFAPQGVSVPAIAPVTLVVPALGQALLDVGRAYRRASVKSVGLRVTSDAPVVAARTLYWGQSLGRSQFGADARSGAPAASTNWDFAGVSVAGDDQPFLTVLAPRGAAHVTAWLHAANGRLLATLRMRVESGQRATLRLLIRQQAGLGPIGVTVRADTPVVAEMPQYNAGSPNVTHHAGDVITGVIDGARYAHLPYLNTTGHAVAALIDVYNPGQSPLNVTVEGFTNRGRQATAHLVVDGGHTALYDVARLGLPRGVLGATLTADGPFVAYAQGAAGAAAEFLSEPAIPLPIEARQAVLVVCQANFEQ